MSASPPDPRATLLEAQSHSLVLGGPGSGKTTLALRKALRRIDAGLSPGQSVLFLSFSRAAVARIAQASRTEVPAGQRQLLSLQTLHSFCWELLRSHAYLLGAARPLRILLPHDEVALSGGAKRGTEEWKAWAITRSKLFVQEGLIAFDLFAETAAEILHRSSLIRDLVTRRYPLIILDEAQDTGPDAWRCIQALASASQVICLADMEQQIFDHLPGVGPERISEIRTCLTPIEVDLGAENNRSAGTEIAAFANDVLFGTARGAGYLGISSLTYDPKSWQPEKTLRMALGMIWKAVTKQTGSPPESCAFLAPFGTGAAKVSAALSAGAKPIPHKVVFDEAAALLASRFAAFLLEPKAPQNQAADVAQSLDLLADMERAKGTAKGRQDSAKFRIWAGQVRAGKPPHTKVALAIDKLMLAAAGVVLTGVPEKDWLLVKSTLRASTDEAVCRVAGLLDYLVAFNRGKRIAASLAAMWTEHGCYLHARDALDSALAQDQILGGVDELTGIHVMTIHKSKGKQFDAVIILREGVRLGANGWRSSFVWRDDVAPYPRSRKILRVAITRARKHVLLVGPAFPACPLLDGHKL